MSEQPLIHRSGSGLASMAVQSLATVVSDLDAAIEWYERVLGFRLEARIELAEGEVAVLGGANVHLELLTPSKMEETPVRLDALFADPPRHMLAIGNKGLVLEVDEHRRSIGGTRRDVGDVRMATEGARSGLVWDGHPRLRRQPDQHPAAPVTTPGSGLTTGAARPPAAMVECR
jgi:catechol 2,3-dioxygenase-like lactoylglutathione lyase family enzyme